MEHTMATITTVRKKPRMGSSRCGVWLLLFFLVNETTAFQFQFQFQSHPAGRRRNGSGSSLFMAKGLGGAKNKQAELAKKMQASKRERDGNILDSSEESSREAESETEVSKERSEFAQLLAKSPPPPAAKKEPQDTPHQDLFRTQKATPAVSTGPKVTSRDLKRKRKAAQAKENSPDQTEGTVVRRLQTLGSKAQRRDFELLIEVETSKPLGPMKAASLVPWVPPFLSNYLVVLADPRRQSTDLYKSIQYLEAASATSSSEPSASASAMAASLTTTICISADSVSEMMAWKKRNNISDTNSIRLLEDRDSQWMNTYHCIRDVDRWSLSVLVLDSNGIIRHHSREVDPSTVCHVVSQAIATIVEEDKS
jgi:hypothetical protein